MRTLSSLLVLAVSAGLLSCGAGVVEPTAPSWARALPDDLPMDGELLVRPEAHDDPSLELRFPWRNRRATLGWGAAHLWARPGRDHVGVTAILDAPSARPAWRECREVSLVADGAEMTVEARYIGRPMNRASMVYEAVQLSLGVHHLRQLASARAISGSICGDPFSLTRAQQATMGRFVEWFDHLAIPRRPGDAPYFRDVGPRPALPFEGDDSGPLES